MQRNDRSYKDLKQKQKSAIADKTYKMYLKFYLENQRMPDAAEINDICKKLFTAVQSLAPKTEFEEFYKIVEKREKSYEERILRDIQNGITLETLMAKKHKKTADFMVAPLIGNILVIINKTCCVEDDMVMDMIFINMGTDHIFIFSFQYFVCKLLP